MNDPETAQSVTARYQKYADDWRAKGRVKEAEAMEEIIALLREEKIRDPRIKEQ